MQTHYILIDFENVQVKSLALLKGDQFRVQVFLGPKNTRLPTELVLAMKNLGDHADYIVLDAGGHNALDFHITYYLGRLAAANPSGSFYIISKDTGFDALIRHMNKAGIQCARAVAVDALPGVTPPAADNIAGLASEAKLAKTKSISKKKMHALFDLVIANLIKRGSAAPQKEKTLRSTIKTLGGTQYSEKEIDAVFNRLIKNKYVTTDGTRVSYNLPGKASKPQ